MVKSLVDQLFEKGMQHQQAGRLREAESVYRQVLAQRPNEPDALHLLAVVQFQLGQRDSALELIRRAITVHPRTAEYHFHLGWMLSRLGRINESIESFNESISLKPNLAEAHNALGESLHTAGKTDAAMRAFEKALAAQPTFALAQYNIGNMFHMAGDLPRAIQAYQRAVAMAPKVAEGHHALGIVLQRQKKFDEAVAAYHRALELRPNFADARSNLGNALAEMGQVDRAIEAYRQAISLQPDWALPYYNMGNALSQKGELDQAIDAFRQAVRCAPNFPLALNNLANILKDREGTDEAIATLQKALSIEPDFVLALDNLAVIYTEIGMTDAAIACLDRALAIRPSDAAAHSNRLYAMHFHPDYDAAQILQEHRQWNDSQARPLKSEIQPHANDHNPSRRLKIGYVSPDFRLHPVGQLLIPLLANHDHEKFEIVCFSSVSSPDRITQQLRKHADAWHDVSRLNDEQLARIIREERIDILVDLSLHTASNRLPTFARKPAPVQITYLAYCSTSGLATMDYRLTDPFLDPLEAGNGPYTEKSIRLPKTYWCYQPRIQAPNPAPPPVLQRGYVTFGCFNNFSKVSATAWNAWQQLLKKIPNSNLMVYAPPGQHRDVARQKMIDAGLDGDRLIFVNRIPVHEYFDQYQQIDIALDPFPYGGGVTTCDAIWMGVPVVTLAGKTAVGRGGESILNNLGLTQWIAKDIAEYVNIAAKLAGDLNALATARSTLRDRMNRSPLMDAAGFAKDIESIYRDIWKTFCNSSD
jgi:protein O-GlcNAc transferase